MKNIFKKFVVLLSFGFVLFGFNYVFAEGAQLSLVSYEVSDTEISPNGDGVRDSVDIDIEYSEEVKSGTAEINIINSNGDKVKSLYVSSSDVYNPHNKNWDGTDDLNQIVPNGLYIIQILGNALADETNTISDESKTITVNNPIPVTLSGISITNPPTKLDYIVGDTLDISGLVVTGTYSDDSTKTETITIDGNITGFDNSTPVIGQVLTITVNEKTVTYTINIAKASGGGGNNTPPSIDIIEGDIILPDNCLISDLEGDTHSFPTEDSPSKFLGICALSESKIQNIVDSFEIIEYPFGLFVDSINGIKDPNTSYWALYLNDIYESRGLTTLPLVVGDKMSLVYVDFNNSELGIRININITGLESSTEEQNITSSSGGGGSSDNQKDFSLDKAISFLSSQQKSDGSFGDSLYTDWVAISVSQAGDEASLLKTSISNYLKNNQINSSVITDYERRAMALMALGINPYNGTNVDYIKKITDSFDGTQIGDIALFNDDIFGLIVLQNAGYDEKELIIKNTISYIISKQSNNGSWGSIDMTSAGIMALKKFNNIGGVSEAINKAENYLIISQNDNGGFDNSASTSWATQALSLNDLYSDEVKDAILYLANKQQDDGGLYGEDINTRIWETSYVIPAVMGKSWVSIMQSFQKLVVVVPVKIENKVVKNSVNVVKPSTVQVIDNLPQEITTDNNLGASAGNAISGKVSLGEISRIISASVIDTLSYIGKGVFDSIIFMQNHLLGIFR